MKLTRAQVGWYGLLPSVSALIEEWNPGRLPSEFLYKQSLVKHLRECAPDAQIDVEYRDKGTTIDIRFDWSGFIGSDEVLIELKRNLQHKSTFDRLIGQLRWLKPEETNIVIVLCGDTNDALLSRLHAEYKHLMEDIILFSRKMVILLKP